MRTPLGSGSRTAASPHFSHPASVVLPGSRTGSAGGPRPVYFRSNGGERELPDLVASLDGQVHLNLVGFVDSVGKKGSEVSRVRNTFAMVPDAPVSRFVLNLKGGKKGLLQNSANLCKVKNVATVKFGGQNGKTASSHDQIANQCGKKKHGKKHHGGTKGSSRVGTSHR